MISLLPRASLYRNATFLNLIMSLEYTSSCFTFECYSKVDEGRYAECPNQDFDLFNRQSRVIKILKVIYWIFTIV